MSEEREQRIYWTEPQFYMYYTTFHGWTGKQVAEAWKKLKQGEQKRHNQTYYGSGDGTLLDQMRWIASLEVDEDEFVHCPCGASLDIQSLDEKITNWRKEHYPHSDKGGEK